MAVGLDALKIFKATGTVEMREKYPSIYREDIDKNCHFNPNDDYLYAPTDTMNPLHTSPWYGFTLIPDTTNEGKSSLDASLYLMQFLNWAIYYYTLLVKEYKSLPPGRPKQQDKVEAQEWADIYANIILEMTGKTYTEEEITEKANLSFQKNKFPLKPSFFLKLCRFFARAWYEERFSSPDNAVGSVEFAHYIGNYIEASVINDGVYNCGRYDGNNDNKKKEVVRLFAEKGNLEYQYHSFHIQLERIDNSSRQEDASYTISISQLGCKHIFYLFARLYQYRYQSPIK